MSQQYANRSKHKLNRVFVITYLTMTGVHYEYVKTENRGRAIEYGTKEAQANGAMIVEVVQSTLPKNLNNNESFTDLI